MTNIRMLIAMIGVAALTALSLGQGAPSAPSAPPPRVKAADAKKHIGETVTVCGKVVDNRKIGKYGLGGYGKPVSFDLDQPESNPVFYFVTFGTLPPAKHKSEAPAANAEPTTGAAPAAGTAPTSGAAPPTTPASAPAASAAPTAGEAPAASGPAGNAQPTGPEEVIAAYKDKNVCVTGKITGTEATGPFILQPDRSQIKIQEENK